jgi:hypothetical protein
MIPLAYAIGAALAVAAVIIDGRNLATVFPIVVTATSVATAGVILLLWRRATLERAAGQVYSAESDLVTSSDPPPAGVAALLGELGRLGFQVIGVTDTAVGRRPLIRVWILTENGGAGTTWAEVTRARRPMVIFMSRAGDLSRAGDGRFIETSYPYGESVDHQYVLARPIESSAEDALREHRAALAQWTSHSGPPAVVRDLDDYRQVEAEFRERTGGLRIGAYLERVVEPGLWRWAISAAIGVVTFFVLVLRPGR